MRPNKGKAPVEARGSSQQIGEGATANRKGILSRRMRDRQIFYGTVPS
jgi:hypothetical protein